jgi:glycosyltransferase involved in cell wall biosynthesis
MKFSIIIPAKDEEDWLPKTLDAVLLQTHKEYEVIVVDNKSTDHTADVARSYAQKGLPIQVVYCPTPGLLAARDCGLAYATGETIAQLDSDSIPPPKWLARAAKHLRNKKVVALGGMYDYYDAPWWFRYPSLFIQVITLPIANWYVQTRKSPKFIKGAFMIGGNAFIRKWVLDDMHGYDLSHTFCSEDLVTAREVAKRGWVKFCLNLTVMTSFRRHIKLGIRKVQRAYNLGTRAVMRGKPIPRQEEETNHPR